MDDPAGRASSRPAQNRFDRMEWAGAFGDFGTLIPFLVVYISVLQMNATGVLLAFGGAMVVAGLYYRTPFPVQPMKAIGAVVAAQAVQTAVVTPGAVIAAALVTGLLWLFLGLSGLAARVSKLVPPIVVAGIVLGLGLGFMLEGVKMMQTGWWIAAFGAAGTLLLLNNRSIPAMLVLLLFGAAVGLYQDPSIAGKLAASAWRFSPPTLGLTGLARGDLVLGTLFLALPQLPLTLGNAVVAIKEENNRLFPHAPVTERKVAVSTGLMNLFGAGVGGVPMCHGAGGMAGHMAFGARTGGSVVILGSILLALAFFFGDSVLLLFKLFPASILGVILFFTGAQLAIGAGPLSQRRDERLVLLATAVMCMWNVAIGMAIGIALHHLARKGLLRL
ncbi:MAG: putative sulfate/molybdate transporter [Rubrivivax sp.]